MQQELKRRLLPAPHPESPFARAILSHTRRTAAVTVIRQVTITNPEPVRAVDISDETARTLTPFTEEDILRNELPFSRSAGEHLEEFARSHSGTLEIRQGKGGITEVTSLGGRELNTSESYEALSAVDPFARAVDMGYAQRIHD